MTTMMLMMMRLFGLGGDIAARHIDTEAPELINNYFEGEKTRVTSVVSKFKLFSLNHSLFLS